MRKHITFVLTVWLTLSLLGCNQNTQPAPSTPAPAPATPGSSTITTTAPTTAATVSTTASTNPITVTTVSTTASTIPSTTTTVPTIVTTITATTTTVPTAVTTRPTTISTAKPTTIPTTKLTTEPTTKPTTISTAKPTTIPTTKHTTEPTTKPNTVPTTVTLTTATTVPTTITTVPTTVPTTAPTHIYNFSEYLDYMNFVPGLSQRKLFDLAESLTYNGKNMREYAPGYYYDSRYGGGYKSQGTILGFSNDYTRSEDGTSATSYNNLYTTVPLDGLILPYRITFEDSLTDVFEKAGLSADPYQDFVSDEDTPGIMTLFRNETAYLTLINYALYPNTSSSNQNTYFLRYVEIYDVTLTDGRIATATRAFTMTFSGSDDTLSRISMYIEMVYPLNPTE